MLMASASYAPLAHFYPALCATLLQGSTHVRPEYQSALNASANLSIHPCLKFLHFPLLLMDPSASLRMTARGAAEAGGFGFFSLCISPIVLSLRPIA